MACPGSFRSGFSWQILEKRIGLLSELKEEQEEKCHNRLLSTCKF